MNDEKQEDEEALGVKHEAELHAARLAMKRARRIVFEGIEKRRIEDARYGL